jgi:hypothetical protein
MFVAGRSFSIGSAMIDTLPHIRGIDPNALQVMSRDDAAVTLPACLVRQIVNALHFYVHGLNKERVVLGRADSDTRVAGLESNPAWIADRPASSDFVLYREDGSHAWEATSALADHLGERYQAIIDVVRAKAT